MKQKIILSIAAALILASGVFLYTSRMTSPAPSAARIIKQSPDKIGESALDLLARTEKITVKEYSVGKLVESINGVKNGTDNNYWILYVNGKQSQVGASDYKINKGDILEWRFEEYQTK